MYVAGAFGSNFNINGTVFQVKSTSSISAIRYNLSNSSDYQTDSYSTMVVQLNWVQHQQRQESRQNQMGLN